MHRYQIGTASGRRLGRIAPRASGAALSEVWDAGVPDRKQRGIR